MLYPAPGTEGSKVGVNPTYGNFIGGKFVDPVKGEFADNPTPVTGKPFTQHAQSSEEDVELALDAAYKAAPAWGEASLAQRAAVLNKIADAVEANLEEIAIAECYDNGKAVRETLNADIPLLVDHFRYFAGAARTEEGTISEIDNDMVAYHFREPLGVVGQIIPFNFPLLMAAWKLAPALAAGNAVVLKPASPTPWSIMKLMEVIGDVVPPGVINVVTGPGAQIGKALATNKRIAKIAFTGETVTGRLIMQYAAQNIIPSTTELGGKSPNIFFADIMDADDDYLDKAIEGLVLYAFNQGEVCTCPSRALIHESIYDEFMARCLDRIAKIKQGSPLDTDTMMGAQVSTNQMDKITGYCDIAASEGAECLIGGQKAALGGDLADGYYFNPTVYKGHNKMRIFQEEIFGPVLAVTTFKDDAEASPTTPCTAWGPASGRATAPAPTAWDARSRPDASGRTATTPTRPRPRSAATRSPASAARITA